MEFVLWDGSTADRHGDRLLIEGLDITNFEKNSVMFFDHQRANGYLESGESSIIGRWENLRVEGSKLYGTPVFDINDESAAEIARKVDEGFIKACSIGFRVIEEDNAIPYISGQRYPTITKAELLEVSIVELPAHQNAVRVKNFQNPPNQKAMDIKELAEKLQTLEAELERVKAENAEKKAGASVEELEKIKADNAEIKKELDSLKTKSNITLADVVGAIKNGNAGATEDRSTWTVFDWQNKDVEGLEKLKTSDPEKYSSIMKKLR